MEVVEQPAIEPGRAEGRLHGGYVEGHTNFEYSWFDRAAGRAAEPLPTRRIRYDAARALKVFTTRAGNRGNRPPVL